VRWIALGLVALLNGGCVMTPSPQIVRALHEDEGISADANICLTIKVRLDGLAGSADWVFRYVRASCTRCTVECLANAMNVRALP
jgi:hypothetical protein